MRGAAPRWSARWTRQTPGGPTTTFREEAAVDSASAEVKAAYQRLEEAIDAVGRLEDRQGVLTEWLVVYSAQRFDDDGAGVTEVGTLLPEGGGSVPYHRVLGLLDFALTRCRAEVAEP